MPTPHGEYTPPTPPRQQLDNAPPKMRQIAQDIPALKALIVRPETAKVNGRPGIDAALQSAFDRMPRYGRE